jgi:hypothetical protein
VHEGSERVEHLRAGRFEAVELFEDARDMPQAPQIVIETRTLLEEID